MTSIALVQQKGGVSKSVTSGHLCHWLKTKGYTVALVDCDAQCSSSSWLSAIAPSPADTIAILTTPDDVLEKLPAIAAKHDYTIIDGPAGISELTRAILLRADLALVPVQPTGFDIQSAADAVRLIKQAQSVREGPPKSALFISRAVKGTRLMAEAVELLSGFGLPLLSSVIHQRQAIADTFGQDATVFDMSGRAAATSAREFDKLFNEVVAL